MNARPKEVTIVTTTPGVSIEMTETEFKLLRDTLAAQDFGRNDWEHRENVGRFLDLRPL